MKNRRAKKNVRNASDNQSANYLIWLRGFFFIFLFISICVIWVYLKSPNTLPIKDVVIEATYQHVSPITLRNAIGPYARGGFFSVDIRDLEKKLMLLPWVEAVSVRRIWPDKLMIHIIEQQPVARWGQKTLINVRGVLFTPPPETIPQNLPILTGPDDQFDTVWKEYQRINELLRENGLGIYRLDLDARGSWSMTLGNGIIIYLGRYELAERLDRFLAAYPKVIAEHLAEIRSIDLRYPNGFAVAYIQNT